MKALRSACTILLVLLAALLMPPVGICAHAGQAKTNADSLQQGAMKSPARVDELDQHFQKAQDDLNNKDTADAAAELHNAAALLEDDANRSAGNAKQMLETSAGQLKQLAQRLESGAVVSEQEIRQTFARVHQALAENHRLKASEAQAQNATSSLGQNLQAAAEHLEKAWIWSGHQLEDASRVVIERSKQLGQKIESGTEWTVAQVVAAMDDLSLAAYKFDNLLAAESVPKVAFATSKKENTPNEAANGPGINLTTAVIQVAKANIPAVVHIMVTESQEVPNPLVPYEQNPFFRRYFGLPKNMPKKFERELMGVGSGMIIDSQGHILTNNHVVGGATKIQVKLSDGSTYPGKVVGTDPKTDLGLIQISADKPLPFVTFADSDQVQVGQWVVAIGQPENLSESVSQGIISAKHRTGITNPSDYEDFLQTDAAINPGNSGGPLLDLDGHVVGVNSAIFSTSGGFQGIGFAIPSNMAAHVADALLRYGKVVRGWIGVSVQDITPELAKSFGLTTTKGALIAAVAKGGPADKAGLKTGDVITALQSKEVTDVAELRNAIADLPVGQEATLTVLHNGKTEQVSVRIGNLEDMNKQLAAKLKERLGVVVEPLSDLQASGYGLKSGGGLVIRWLDPNGPLAKAGFEVGDIILAVDSQPAEGVDTFADLVDSLPRGHNVALTVWDHRTGQTGRIEVTLR